MTEISLHELLVDTENEHSTFFAKAQGVSMQPHMFDGDIAILERHLNLQHDAVALLSLDNGKLICRRYDRENMLLLADNRKFTPIEIVGHSLSCEGVIGKVIRLHRPVLRQ
ncbi:S24 family peptidase [Vibrio owensii]|uniref:S24 family peptidase n=1 Tax=Vibrio owensii TaxID=696485 RepID=UPI0040682F7F